MNYLLATVGVLGVSAAAPLMAGTQAPAFAIAFWRNAMATAALVPVATATRRTELRGLSVADVRTTAFAGLMLAGHFATWVTALKMTSVAAATALACTQIGWVVLLGRLRGEMVSRAVVIGLAVSASGVLVISGVDLTLSTRALVGDLLAIAGGFFVAGYMVAGGSLRQRLTTTAYTVLCYGTCSVVLALLCVATGSALWGYAASTWLGLVAVTVCAQLLGHSVFNHLLATMSPTLVALILLLEVPGAAILAGIFLGQSPAIGVYVGLILILAGLGVVVTWRAPRAEQVVTGD